MASKENKWLGRNITRWQNEEYDDALEAGRREMDPVKRAAMFIRMNDLVIQNVVVIPVIWRARVAAVCNKLKLRPERLGLEPGTWRSGIASADRNWYRESSSAG